MAKGKGKGKKGAIGVGAIVGGIAGTFVLGLVALFGYSGLTTYLDQKADKETEDAGKNAAKGFFAGVGEWFTKGEDNKGWWEHSTSWLSGGK